MFFHRMDRIDADESLIVRLDDTTFQPVKPMPVPSRRAHLSREALSHMTADTRAGAEVWMASTSYHDGVHRTFIKFSSALICVHHCEKETLFTG